MFYKDFILVAGGYRYTVKSINTVEFKILFFNGFIRSAILI